MVYNMFCSKICTNLAPVLWIMIVVESCLILPLSAQSTYIMKMQCLWFIGVYHTVMYYPQKKILKIHKKFIKIQNPWGILLLEYYVIKDFIEIIFDNYSSLMLVYFLMGKMELLYSCSLCEIFFANWWGHLILLQC